jgi:hypothetical protein
MPRGVPKRKFNKSEWIRQQPATLGAKEVVEKAKKEKIEITVGQVYTARHAAKQQDAETTPKAAAKSEATAVPAVTRGRPKTAAAVADSSSAVASVRQEFNRLAIKVGSIEMDRMVKAWQREHGV